jgi:hypothetical protein
MAFQSSSKSAFTEARRVRVAELYVHGLDGRKQRQSDIARIIADEFPSPSGSGKPYSQSSIANDLKCMRQEWRTQRAEKIDEMIDLELARIDQVEREAWVAWERSVGKNTTITEKTSADGSETSIKTEKLAGDPRFLSIQLDCVKKRCEVLGLNADTVQKLKLSNPDGSPITGIAVTFIGPKDDNSTNPDAGSLPDSLRP